MMETTKGLDDMDVWREAIQQDINELKNRQSQMDNNVGALQTDINKLKMSEQLQDQEIKTLKESLFEIKDDTNFIRRKITGAIITAGISAVVMGLIGIAIATIFG